MKVHELIDKPEKWLKKFVASTAFSNPDHSPSKNGRILSNPFNPAAKSFCFYGGLCKVFNNSWPEMEKASLKIEAATGHEPISWNNSPDLTFEEFHRVLVEADV